MLEEEIDPGKMLEHDVPVDIIVTPTQVRHAADYLAQLSICVMLTFSWPWFNNKSGIINTIYTLYGRRGIAAASSYRTCTSPPARAMTDYLAAYCLH